MVTGHQQVNFRHFRRKRHFRKKIPKVTEGKRDALAEPGPRQGIPQTQSAPCGTAEH